VKLDVMPIAGIVPASTEFVAVLPVPKFKTCPLWGSFIHVTPLPIKTPFVPPSARLVAIVPEVSFNGQYPISLPSALGQNVRSTPVRKQNTSAYLR